MAVKLTKEEEKALKGIIAAKKSGSTKTKVFRALTKDQQKRVKEEANIIYNGVPGTTMGACIAIATRVVKSMDKKPPKRKT